MYLSNKQLAERYSVDPATVWRWSKQTDFPKAHLLGPNTRRWKATEIEAWEASKNAA